VCYAAICGNNSEFTFDHHNIIMFGMNYGNDPSSVINLLDKNTHIVMVDFSFARSVMERIDARAGKFTWCDHHRTALEAMKGMDLCGMQSEIYSGCELAWAYFFPKTIFPKIVKYLGRYDVWDLDDGRHRLLYAPTSLAVTAMLPELRGPMLNMEDFAKWERVFEDDAVVDKELLVYGQTATAGIAKTNERIMKERSFCTNWENMCCICANGARGALAFESVISAQHQMAVGFVFMAKGWAFSLYALKSDVDVSAVAKKYGGGGHPGAAGFVMPQDTNPLIFLGLHG